VCAGGGEALEQRTAAFAAVCFCDHGEHAAALGGAEQDVLVHAQGVEHRPAARRAQRRQHGLGVGGAALDHSAPEREVPRRREHSCFSGCRQPPGEAFPSKGL